VKEKKNNATNYNKTYYAVHREEIAIRHKAYHAAHREIDNARVRAHRINNLERYRACDKARYAANREKVRIRVNAYRATHREEKRAYDIAHREEEKLHHGIYYAAHKKELKAKHRLYKHGLSQIAFEELLNKQGGGCAICGKVNWNGRGPCIDHGHITGKIRGILCFNCNVALGMIGDDPKIARSIIDYLNSEMKVNNVQR